MTTTRTETVVSNNQTLSAGASFPDLTHQVSLTTTDTNVFHIYLTNDPTGPNNAARVEVKFGSATNRHAEEVVLTGSEDSSAEKSWSVVAPSAAISAEFLSGGNTAQDVTLRITRGSTVVT